MGKGCEVSPSAWGACRGGCRRYRDPAEGGAPGESSVLGLNRLCEAYEMFFSECADRVVRLAQRMKG